MEIPRIGSLQIPIIGFGTYQINNRRTFELAYQAGYRHFDSATMY